jgi:hypothetical protein
LEDRGVKLAAWKLMMIGGSLLLAADWLRAETPETLPEPLGNSSRSNILQQNPPAVESWFDSPHSELWNKSSDDSSKNSSPDEAAPCDPGPLMAQGPHAYPASSGYLYRDGSWYGDFDFVVWHRTLTRGGNFGVEVATNTQQQQNTVTGNGLNVKGNELPLQAGARGTLGYFLDRDCDNRDHSIEIGYLGFNNWQGANSLIAQPALGAFTFALQPIPANQLFTGFSNAQQFISDYRSDLQSLELNYRIRNRPGRDQMVMGPDGFWSSHVSQGRTESLFVGLRGLSEEEQFHVTSINTNLANFGGDYRINTKNHLLGCQMGGDLYDIHEYWYWGVKGDVGLYCNFVDGSANVFGTDPSASATPLNVHNHATAQTAAFYGELTFTGGYEINSHLLLHAGWDLAQLGGLALAPENVSFTSKLLSDTPFTRNDGQIFLTGLSVGLDAYW